MLQTYVTARQNWKKKSKEAPAKQHHKWHVMQANNEETLAAFKDIKWNAECLKLAWLALCLIWISSSDVQKALSQWKFLKSCRTDCLDAFALKLSKASPVITVSH